MRYQLVVFDIAGTTVADPGLVETAFLEAVRAVGRHVDAAELRRLMGYAKPVAISRLLSLPVDAPEVAAVHADFVARMLAVVARARDEARGHEAVLVSHQSPVWITRLKLENRHLWHDPRKRQCSLASLTSLTYDDDRLVAIAFSEPAASLLPGASPVAGA